MSSSPFVGLLERGNAANKLYTVIGTVQGILIVNTTYNKREKCRGTGCTLNININIRSRTFNHMVLGSLVDRALDLDLLGP